MPDLSVIVHAAPEARVRVTVQVADFPALSDVGEQLTELSSPAFKLRSDVAEYPFADAVIVAVPSTESVPTEAVNWPLDVPAGMATLPGTETLELFDESVVVNPVFGALVVSASVQIAELRALSLEGEHMMELTRGTGTSVIFAVLDCPLTLAVRTTVTPETPFETFETVNVPLACPGMMVTPLGTLK